MFDSSLGVPKCKAVGEGAMLAAFDEEGCGKFIAIAEVVEVVSSFVNKSAARTIIGAFAVVEWVDVA